jgi:hypothetical protein
MVTTKRFHNIGGEFVTGNTDGLVRDALYLTLQRAPESLALLRGATRLGWARLVVPDGPELDVVTVLVNRELALGAGTHPGLLR